MTSKPLKVRALVAEQDVQRFANLLAKLENVTEQQAQLLVAGFQQQLGGAFGDNLLLVEEAEAEELLGGVLLRSSPQHGYELVGGCLSHPRRREAGLRLLDAVHHRALHDDVPGTYAFANERAWELMLLERVGYVGVAHTHRLHGDFRHAHVTGLPSGYSIKAFADHKKVDDLVTALRFYEDLWGHHYVDVAQVREDLQGFDPQNILLLFDAAGCVAGVCRAMQDGAQGWIDAPSLRPDLRPIGLQSLLLSAIATALKAREVQAFTVEAWGEAPEAIAAYLALGLEVGECEAIVARGAASGIFG